MAYAAISSSCSFCEIVKVEFGPSMGVEGNVLVAECTDDIKCHCQRKPGRGHGSRSADSFEIPTTDYLSDMIVKYSLFNLIGDFSCEFDHPPCFWVICIGLPSQFGVTCTSYFSYLLLVFSAFFIYLDYLRFDPIVFM